MGNMNTMKVSRHPEKLAIQPTNGVPIKNDIALADMIHPIAFGRFSSERFSPTSVVAMGEIIAIPNPDMEYVMMKILNVDAK